MTKTRSTRPVILALAVLVMIGVSSFAYAIIPGCFTQSNTRASMVYGRPACVSTNTGSTCTECTTGNFVDGGETCVTDTNGGQFCVVIPSASECL